MARKRKLGRKLRAKSNAKRMIVFRRAARMALTQAVKAGPGSERERLKGIAKSYQHMAHEAEIAAFTPSGTQGYEK